MFGNGGFDRILQRRKVRLSSDSGTTSAYGAAIRTCSGTSGTDTLTMGSSIDAAAFGVGSVVHVGGSDHEYTVLTASGTTVTVTPNLIQTYNPGTGFKIETVSAWTGSRGFDSSADQSTVADRPGLTPAVQNSLNVLEFNGGTKKLTIPTSTKVDDIFATGGTVAVLLELDSDGDGNAGRILEKLSSSNALVWNLVTISETGGFCKLQFTYATDDVTGVWRTSSFVVEIGTPKILTVSYDASDPTTKPEVRVSSKPVVIEETTAPVGTPLVDTGGALNIGNNEAQNRGMDARLMTFDMWDRVLTAWDLGGYERSLYAKWGAGPSFLTTRYYGGRSYVYDEPSSMTLGAETLLICLHGGTGTGGSFQTQLDLDALLGEEVIQCYPTATENNSAERTWNSNDETIGPDPTFNNAPDSEYISSLIDYMISLGYVDPTKVFLVGHSNGGMMAYRMAVDHPTKIAGVFAMSCAVMVTNPDTYTGKILHYHGEDDDRIPIDGGLGVGGRTYPVPLTSVQLFTNSNGGSGVVDDTDFIELPSPAEHTIDSLETALTLAPYSTTLQQEIYDFVTT